MLLRHPVPAAVLATAFTLTAGLFLFARPQYRPPSSGKTIDLSRYPAPIRAWTWKGGTPGFTVRSGDEDWNVSKVRPQELPVGARLLNAQRDADGLSLLVARPDTAGRACVGAEIARSTQWFCPPRLGPQVAFVVVDAVSALGGQGFPINLVGVARGDVRRVVITAPEVTRTMHPDNSVTASYRSKLVASEGRGNWGTFSYSLGDGYRGRPPAKPWRARLDFYGAHGLLASRKLAFAQPGMRLVVVPKQ